MSHEISIIEHDGRHLAEAVYNSDPAWHGLGEVFTGQGPLTSDRAMELAHLDWHVSKRPIYAPSAVGATDVEAGAVEIPGSFATFRDDINKPLGVVGERYRVFQNRECFGFLDSLVMDGVLTYESAFALQGGSKLCLLARLPKVDIVAESDPVMRYLMLTTAHDGSGAIDILPTTVRVVCANTIALARSQASTAAYRATIRHTDSMRQNLDAARQFILETETAFASFADNARKLVDRKISRDQAREYIETLFPAPSAEGTEVVQDDAWGIALPAKVVTAKAVTIHQNKIAAVRDAFRNPSNQLPAIQGSWWQMLNAVTFYVDHESRTRGLNDSARRENRFLNVTDGIGARFKMKALNTALAMSA
jgi:phage/plasmid-like protein (TIGR03299 family)